MTDGRLGHDILCVGARHEGSENDNHVELVPCDAEDTWEYDARLALLQHQPSGRCLKVITSRFLHKVQSSSVC